jgi:prepilin-type N-terminal cleavage/methylation domain-containing protein/prepilin-type processing-associated H-X9-DG protein
MHSPIYPPAPAARLRSTGFTLVELLVVIGIIGLLMALLVPTLSGTRRQAGAVQCASNVRQLCIALFGYAADHKGKFPSNLSGPAPGSLWHLPWMAGGYVCKEGATKDGVFTCPDDREGAKRSYAMNVWASSALEPTVAALTPKRGQLWGPTPRDNSRLILITESWSGFGTDDEGREASAVIGYRGLTAGQRFGGGSGVAPPADYGPFFGKANSELSFARHRPSRSPGTGNLPIGAVHIGYADGHVSLKTDRDLVDAETGRSTLDSLWSAWDLENP